MLSFTQNQSETEIIKSILPLVKFKAKEQENIIHRAQIFVKAIRNNKKFCIEEFLNLYSLSHPEGVAILGLAEALLRIPDDTIVKALITDKLSKKQWHRFLFARSKKSFLTIIASVGLYIGGKFTDIATAQTAVSEILRRLGYDIFIKAVKTAVIFLSEEFVFADNITNAVKNTHQYRQNKFSFDLLGESARTQKQANIYYEQYLSAIAILKNSFPYKNEPIEDRPNLSVKLTALHPRFELARMPELINNFLPKIVNLVRKTQEANITITFDAEEAKRTDAYLIFLTELMRRPECKEFSGIGFVVQAYQTKSLEIVRYLINLAQELGRRIPVRLVKGAYWDAEIKQAQDLGLRHYPVFTVKEYTDVNYIACAKLILENDHLLYPQFATHNAVTVSTIIELAKNKKFEFQKLYGMGNILHQELSKYQNVRIYAPVGQTKDLLAYLIRRLLENGASTNFVSKVNSLDIPVDQIVYNNYDRALSLLDKKNKIPLPENIYPKRKNAMGHELGFKNSYDYIHDKVSSYFDKVHNIGSIIDGREIIVEKNLQEGFCPSKYAEKFSTISNSVEKEIKTAMTAADAGLVAWSRVSLRERCAILEKIARLLEENKFELYALLIKEAGKSIHDAINEVIEAIDFCRYYANQARILMQDLKLPGPSGESNILSMKPRGVFLCISPWNFPLAIFTGQIVAALVAGNTVIAKPATQTPVIANFTTKIMHQAGVPKSALHLVLTSGSNTGNYAVPDERIKGVAFTGSSHVAQLINISLAQKNSGIVPLIAETGGQNAMIVDSSALLEQVTDDVLLSAFYSAGQRCSALRMLYVQEEIYDELLEMIKGATETLQIGDTADFATDIGPVIDENAKTMLESHILEMREKGFSIFHHPQLGIAKYGHYFYPHIIEVSSINDIPDEKFGPILHIAKYKAANIDQVIDEINNCGYSLTFGIHSRVEERIEYIKARIQAGNIYINRSIVGAKVESQPFGGHNKSGTGFKAGGPNYLLRFMVECTISCNLTAFGGNIDLLIES